MNQLAGNTAGAPAITVPNVYRVPAVLSVDLSGITDGDGVTGIAGNATYKWQRFAADGTTLEADNIGTDATYTLVAADVGKKIKVQVSFTDDGGNAEGPLTSAAVPGGTDTVTAAATCNAPTYSGGAVEVWTGTVTVGRFKNASGVIITYGFGDDGISFGALDDTTFTTLGSNDYDIDGLGVVPNNGNLLFSLTTPLTADEARTLVLHACDEAFALSAVTFVSSAKATYQWGGDNPNLDWSTHAERTLYLSQDTVAPMFDSAAADGDSLVITFDEPLGEAADLANGAFTVTKGGGNDTVALGSTAPVIDGSTVTLTLAAALTPADTSVKVSYTRPTTGTDNKLADAFGNEVGTFSGRAVTNETSDAPVITSVAVTSTPTGGYYRAGETISITATFDHAVTVDTGDGTPYILVRVGVGNRAALYASGSGSTALVFSYTVADGDEDQNGIAWPARALILNGGTIKRTHTDPARRADAVLSVALQAALAGHKVDAVAPVVRTAAIAGTTLTLTFSEPLAAAASLANDAFAVTRNAANTAVTLSGSPAISGDTVTLTLSAALAATDTNVKVAYTKPGSGSNNKLADAFGNEVENFTRTIPTAANTPATGAFLLSGHPRVGGTVSVPQPSANITDMDGVPADSDPSWHYQWVRVDGVTETDIEGETSMAYRITAADEGKKLKVKVGFTDNLGNPELLTSAAYPSRITIRPNPPPPTQCAEPDLAGRTQVWRSTLYTDVYGADLGGESELHYGYVPVGGVYTVGFFRPANLGFTVNGNAYSIGDGVYLSWTSTRNARLTVFLNKALAAADRQTLQLLVCDEVFNFKDAQFGASNDNRWFDTGMDWYDHRTRELRLVVDNTAPAPADMDSAVLAANGRDLTLTYNEALSTASVPAASAFTVRATPAGGSETTLALVEADPDNNIVPVAVDGSTVTLTLAAPAAHNDTLTLSYTKPTGADAAPLEDLGGNDAADFTDRAVTNNSAIPRVSIAAVYPDATPGIADPVFRVTRSNTDADNALSVSLGFTQTDTYIGSTGTITIPAGQASAMQTFNSNYTGNTGGELTATVTGAADHLPALAPDDTATVQVSAPASGTAVDLAFDNANEFEVAEGDSVDVTLTLTVAAGLAAPREDFLLGLLTDEGTATLLPDADYTHVATNVTVSAAGWQGTGPYTQTLTQTVATVQDALYEGPEQFRVRATRGPGAPPVVSSDCPSAHQVGSSICSALVTINDDEAALALETLAVSSAPANGTVYLAGETLDISATFNGNVNVDTAGGAPKFTLDLGGETRRAAWADGSGTRTLVFRYTVAAGDEDHDGIAWAADALDLDGGTIKLRHADPAQQVDAALTHGAQGPLAEHKVDARGPGAEAATVNGTSLIITFSETLAEAASLANTAFGVTKGASDATVALGSTGPVLSDNTLTLTLGAAITAEDDNVMVTYTKPTTTGTGNKLADALGNETATFTHAVRNLLGDTDPPVLAEVDPALLAADGETLTLTFNEPLDEDSVPPPAAFMLTLGGHPGAVQEVAVSGSTVVLTLAAEFPAHPRDTVTLSYTGGTSPVRDLAGNAAADFANQAVDNRTVSAPGAPGSVTATPGNRLALLRWAAPAADGGAGITGYQYRVSADGGATWDPDWTGVPDGPDTDTDPGNEREVTVGQLENGVSYTFEVRAFNGAHYGAPGRAGATPAREADPAADPGPVRGLRALALDRGVALGWSAPLDDGHRPPLRYQVRHARGNSVPAATAWTDAGPAPEYTVGGLDNGVAYSFEVRALNSRGPGGPGAGGAGDPERGGHHGGAGGPAGAARRGGRTLRGPGPALRGPGDGPGGAPGVRGRDPALDLGRGRQPLRQLRVPVCPGRERTGRDPLAARPNQRHRAHMGHPRAGARRALHLRGPRGGAPGT